MNKLGQLTASLELCNELVDLGVEEIAFLWHTREAIDADNLTDWEVKPVQDPTPLPDTCVPAWTKAELEAMIGPNLQKPDLFTDKELALTIAGEKKDTPYPYKRFQYPVFMPDMLKVFKNGADAAAFVLKLLIEHKHIKPEDCIKRYKQIFKP